MIDLSYFQNNSRVDTKVFAGKGYTTWQKPRGAKFVNILCIGGGGGGGGGFQSATGNIGGGGGGASGATTRAYFRALNIPDLLYISVGAGGTGGLGGSFLGSGGEGNNAEPSAVLFEGTYLKGKYDNVLVASSIEPGVNIQGGTGGSTVGGIAPASFLSQPIASFLLSGNFNWSINVKGGDGSTTTGNPATISSIVSGGGGGGGTLGASSWSATGPVPALPNSNINSKGADGIIIYKPTLIFTGGIGGGGGTTGGNGGDGAYGCGGGGGGAGTVSGGNGGRGGDGIIIITTYR